MSNHQEGHFQMTWGMLRWVITSLVIPMCGLVWAIMYFSTNLQRDVTDLKTDVSNIKSDMNGVKQKVDTIERRQAIYQATHR